MAIMIECPLCHRKQKSKNKKCCECQTSIDRHKQNGKVRYWITYRLDKKQIWELIGYSADDAQAFETDRIDRINKGTLKTKEDLKPKPPALKPQDTMTFKELSDWYIEQDFVKGKKSCW